MTTFLAGQRLLAQEVETLQEFATPKYVLKTIDESVTSSTTRQSDNELVLAAAVNAVYDVELKLIYQGATGGDINFDFTWPSGAIFQWSVIGLDPAAAAIVGNVVVSGFSTYTSGTTNGAVGAVTGNVLTARVGGTLSMGATAGNLQFRWAQFVSSATATTVMAGSTLRATRVG